MQSTCAQALINWHSTGYIRPKTVWLYRALYYTRHVPVVRIRPTAASTAGVWRSMDTRPRLPPDLAAAIGEFIVTWTAAQTIVVFAVSDLKASKPINAGDAPAVTPPPFGVDARTHLGVLNSLATACLPPASATRIKKLTKKTADLGNHRNDLANGLWEKQPKRGSRRSC